MTKVREAKLSDIKSIEGKENLLGGPSFSFSALETFMKTPDFSVRVAGDSGMVLYHEGKGGKSRMLLLIGPLLPELLEAAESCSRRAGTVKIVLEVDPRSVAVPWLQAGGYIRKGELPNYFGKGRSAFLMERLL